ncbi:uncharacterized protein LOC125578022 [Brassica napus]|uniref:uncharacterized protein LOC125578022 n=1 Tax=Brassica napus TaxID=3708 RepID=UPI002078A0BF|nr:uncharacterized protein LOC125578022 [Brassica napus]
MALPEWGDVPPLNDEDSDGENRTERNDYNIEQAVIDFDGESPIRHNVYPDTESDDEEEEVQRTVRKRNNIVRGEGNLFEGQVFSTGLAFKEAVLDYALKTSRNLKQYRYDKDKLGYNCVGDGCSWRIYCSTTGKTFQWQVKVFKNVHSCVPNGCCEMIKVPVIARLFVDKIREEPEYFMPMKIEKLIMEKWKINVSRPQCQAARNKALRWIAREYDEQFARLHDYVKEILESNPNSSVELECLPDEKGLELFNRFYVCFDILRRSWKDTCRQIIGVDGCHLKSEMKGMLLVALGRDPDNAIYPIAWAVVQVENTNNLLWFVKKIKDDLGLLNGEGFIMVSDRQKGLIKAVQTELPEIEHRMCVRHIYTNLKGKHGKKGTDLKLHVWNLAWSYNEPQYYENLDRIFNYDSQLHEDVLKTNPKSWSRAFFKLGNYCEDVENNSTESWNNTILKARDKPYVPMLEMIARQSMVRIAKRSVITLDHRSLCTPYVIEYLEEELEKASAFWPVGEEPRVHQAPEPPQPGRKKGEKDGKRGNNSKKRKKGINESPTKKKPKMLKRIMHCSQCGVANHNSRFHKKAQQAPQRDSSQVESSQAQE